MMSEAETLVTYPENPAQSAQDFRNPKSEVRNPKQVRNSNAEIFKRPEGPVLFFGCFDFSSIVSDCLMSACGLGTGFEIRVSRGGVPGVVKSAGWMTA